MTYYDALTKTLFKVWVAFGKDKDDDEDDDKDDKPRRTTDGYLIGDSTARMARVVLSGVGYIA